jgi:hypothetical protein
VSDEADGPGPVEEAIRRDLAQLGRLDTGVRSTLSQMVLKMARSYDRYEGADLAKLARLNQELRQTLMVLTTEANSDGDGEQAAHLSTPVWHAAEPGAADAGPAGGGGGGEAG